MRILINLSNNLGGGGLQVALSFIDECRSIPNEYVVVINCNNQKLINISSYPPNFTFFVVKNNKYLFLAKKLTRIEKKTKPDVVFTVFGPSYWRPKAPHLMGYAIPHYFLQNDEVFEILRIRKLIKRLKFLAKKQFHLFFFKRDADAIVCETEDAKERASLLIQNKSFFTVSNVCSRNYIVQKPYEKHLLPEKNGNFRCLLFSKYYPHKNIELIPLVLKELHKRGVSNIHFVLTIDDTNFHRIFANCNDTNRVLNIGFVKPEDGYKLYSECDALFLPTTLECFSATYVEAMACKKPILTSDQPFAHTVCNKAALYFDVKNISAIADAILKIYSDANLRNTLVAEGEKRLKTFGSATERAHKYLQICSEMIGNRLNCEQFKSPKLGGGAV